MGFALRCNLRRSFLLPATVADGLHQLSRAFAVVVRLDSCRWFPCLHLQHDDVPPPAHTIWRSARGADGLAAEPRRSAHAGIGLLAATDVGVAVAAGARRLLHRPRHPSTL